MQLMIHNIISEFSYPDQHYIVLETSCPKELYILTEMETQQIFHPMFVTLKKFKELFYLTWNGITASVSFVSLTLVVLLDSLIGCGARKQQRRREPNKHGHSHASSELKHIKLCTQ